MIKTDSKKNKNEFSKGLPDENISNAESKIDEGDKNFPFYKFKLQKLLMQMEKWEMHILIESYITKLFMCYQFNAIVLKYADKDGQTFIVFQIPPDVIEEINKIRNNIASYKIQFQHEK